MRNYKHVKHSSVGWPRGRTGRDEGSELRVLEPVLRGEGVAAQRALHTGPGDLPLPAPPHWLGLGMAPLRPALIPPLSLASWRAFAAVAAPVVRPGDRQATPRGEMTVRPQGTVA